MAPLLGFNNNRNVAATPPEMPRCWGLANTAMSRQLRPRGPAAGVSQTNQRRGNSAQEAPLLGSSENSSMCYFFELPASLSSPVSPSPPRPSSCAQSSSRNATPRLSPTTLLRTDGPAINLLCDVKYARACFSRHGPRFRESTLGAKKSTIAHCR